MDLRHAVENGGFASFDADNDHTYLNEIPFADQARCSIRRPKTSARAV
jgi:hypothetical protein